MASYTLTNTSDVPIPAGHVTVNPGEHLTINVMTPAIAQAIRSNKGLVLKDSTLTAAELHADTLAFGPFHIGDKAIDG